MKTYSVIVPFAGYFEAIVEADNEDEAKEKAFESRPFSDEDRDSQVIEFEFYERLVSGNVCHVMQSEIEINEIDDEN